MSHSSTSSSYAPGDSGFAASDWTEQAVGGDVRLRGRHFVDRWGRVLLMRGANVSGASKLPIGQPSHVAEGFFEHNTVSFVGRPFPLEEAPTHLSRLRTLGLTLIRFLVTWESLEHAGPGVYDDEYVSYVRTLVQMLPRYGMRCIINAHQDVWSRFAGGSGAPGWTLEVAGFDIEAFKHTGAAYLHSQNLNPEVDPGPFVWPSGYQKLAAGTMATLFWAGSTFAWKDTVSRKTSTGEMEEVSIQDFLQNAYINAYGYLADRLDGCEAVLGYEAMNEPHRGYISLHSWHSWNFNTDLHIGTYPNLLQSVALGSGYAQKVPYYVKSWPVPTRISHHVVVDPKGRNAWKGGRGGCVWRRHGAWEWDEEKARPEVLRESFFEKDPRTGKRVEWYADFYWPFVRRFAERMRNGRPEMLVFFEPIPNEFCPTFPSPPENMVLASHFYDLNVLFNKAFTGLSVNVQGLSRGMFILNALYWGEKGVKRNYFLQLRTLIARAYAAQSVRTAGGDTMPIIIGETGIPFDINACKAFRTGDYGAQNVLMDAIISALERNLVGFTLWNYCAENEDEWGDGWNAENFSFYSPGCKDRTNPVAQEDDEDKALYAGCRTLASMVRPYAAKVAGIPVSTAFSRRTFSFQVRYVNPVVSTQGSSPSSMGGGARRGPIYYDADVVGPLSLPGGEEIRARETEIFVPRLVYANKKVKVEVSDGTWRLDLKKQTLYVVHADNDPHRVHVVDLWVEDADGKGGEGGKSGKGAGLPRPVWADEGSTLSVLRSPWVIAFLAALMLSIALPMLVRLGDE